MNQGNEKVTLFYDGDCGLCNRSVGFILRHERNTNLFFAPLQSDFAKGVFGNKVEQSSFYDAIKVDTGGFVLEKSAAVRYLIRHHLKWYFYPSLVLFFFPLKWKDSVYDGIAKRRKKITKPFCVVPDKRALSRFMD